MWVVRTTTTATASARPCGAPPRRCSTPPHADWTLAFDIGANRNPDREGPRTQSYALLGGIYHLNKDVDLDLGYRRSLQSGPVTHTLGAGLTVRW